MNATGRAIAKVAAMPDFGDSFSPYSHLIEGPRAAKPTTQSFIFPDIMVAILPQCGCERNHQVPINNKRFTVSSGVLTIDDELLRWCGRYPQAISSYLRTKDGADARGNPHRKRAPKCDSDSGPQKVCASGFCPDGP
jgi:hypothetical protein